MADVELHQIEYRHHQTMDLSPVASSMNSRNSLAAWDIRIRAWVRHPHTDMLSESACYQVFSGGQAALAWRYWDERAASREDGTLGRPLVSRVLVGPESALTPEVALALCVAGLSPEWAGPLPGQVPDGSRLPTISGEALAAGSREMTSALDQASATQEGLQAVVAAALAEPAAPLAISIDDALIQEPLRQCVQCPLLWGLRRITGPLGGPVGRGWSFSTFELPLGKTDPASLPGIVFREVQDGGMKAPPSRWRREAKVRPFEEGALGEGTSYAGMIEQAGWLIAEYQKRGGDGLGQFITERCGSGASFATRMAFISEALRKAHRPPSASGQRRLGGLGLLGGRPAAPVPEAARPTGPLSVASASADPASASAATRVAAGSAASEPADSAFENPESGHPGGSQTETAQPGATKDGGSEPGDSSDELAPYYDSRPGAPQPAASRTDETRVRQPAADGTGPAGGQHGSSRYPESLSLPSNLPSERSLARPPSPGGAGHGHGSPRPPASPFPRSGEAETRPRMPLEELRGTPAEARPPLSGERNSGQGSGESLSSLLQRLEYLEKDQQQFDSILYRISRINGVSAEERRRSWEVISSSDWYRNICKNNEFRLEDLEAIFSIAVIASPAEQLSAEIIARWARSAPPPMVGGLLAAAKRADVEVWHSVIEILEPTLAYRWANENFIVDYWSDRRMVVRSPVGADRDEGNRILGRLRRSGRKP